VQRGDARAEALEVDVVGGLPCGGGGAHLGHGLPGLAQGPHAQLLSEPAAHRLGHHDPRGAAGAPRPRRHLPLLPLAAFPPHFPLLPRRALRAFPRSGLPLSGRALLARLPLHVALPALPRDFGPTLRRPRVLVAVDD